jgi:hypothetical protein
VFNCTGGRNDEEFNLAPFRFAPYFWQHGQFSVDSGTDYQTALILVKGGAKVDHWGGAKGYQQRER